MIIARYTLPDPLSGYVAISGIGIMLAGLVMHSVKETLTVAKYSHLSAWVRPDWKTVHFFYWDFKSTPLGGGRFLTTLFLGFWYKHREYGKIDRILVYHNLPWKARIKLRKGLAYRNGIIVDHSQTDHVIFYEHKEPVIDHSVFLPAYDLIEGGGDYPHLADTIRVGYQNSPEVTMERQAEEELET